VLINWSINTFTGCLIDILTRTPTFLVVEGMNVEEGTEVPKMEKVIPNVRARTILGLRKPISAKE
jgi:hypothetical protein